MYFVNAKMKASVISNSCSVKNKSLILFLGLAVFFVTDCAKIAAPSPLRADYTETGEEITSNISVSGTIIENRDSVGVQKFDEASWIKLQFRGEIDTTSEGISVMDIAGEEVSYIREWDVSEDVTELVLKPQERLNYNSIYILKISGVDMYNLKGEHVDINRNGIRGELRDDDFVFAFVTFKSDNSNGDWHDIAEDKIPPFVVPTVRFLAEEKPTDYIWTDADIALYIYDYTWEEADTSIKVGVLDTATVDEHKFEIVEEKSKQPVSIGNIEYIADPDTAYFGRVVIDPANNLKPGAFYTLKVRGGIADSSGNKLGTEDSVVFEKKFKTFFCNYDSSECVSDTVSPVVLNLENIGSYFEASFSELIDPETVSDSSVYIPDVEGDLYLRNEGGQTFVRFIASGRLSLFGYTVHITEEVADIAGNNIKEEVIHYFER